MKNFAIWEKLCSLWKISKFVKNFSIYKKSIGPFTAKLCNLWQILQFVTNSPICEKFCNLWKILQFLKNSWLQSQKPEELKLMDWFSHAQVSLSINHKKQEYWVKQYRILSWVIVMICHCQSVKNLYFAPCKTWKMDQKVGN